MIRQTSQRGFVLAGLLILSPLFLSVLCVLGSSGLVLMEWSRDHYLCRTHLVLAQKQMGHKLKSLVSLNPQARRLRQERVQAEQSILLAAGNPVAMATAQARLAAITLRQFQFHRRQRLILTEARYEATRWLNQLKAGLRADVVDASSPKLAVKPVPPLSFSPDYLPVEKFEKTQRLMTTWHWSPVNHLPPWILKNLPPPPTLQGACAATLKQQGDLWIPVLDPAKSWRS